MTRLCRHKLFATALFLAVFSLYSASAAAISFQIIQHDPAQDKVRSASYVMETVLFDSFFDSGHIATNIPTAVSAGEDEDEDIFFNSLADSKEGKCKYLVMITIDYKTNASGNPEAVLLSNIQSASWVIYDTDNEKIVEKGTKAVGTVPDRSNNAGGVKDFAKKLTADINSAIRKK